MGDETKGHGPVPRSLPDPGAGERAEGIAEQAAQAARRKVVVDAAREIADRSAQLNERLRDR
jgi:hypothetical protein